MSSSAEVNYFYSVPIMALEYRDIGCGEPPMSNGDAAGVKQDPALEEIVLTAAELAERIRRERAEASRQVEERLRKEYEPKLHGEHGRVSKALAAFETERDAYFSRVEAEVVQLALAIAAKILHREAQVDSTLIAALVRVALERMREGSSVTVRVSPAQAVHCKQYFSKHANLANIQITSDPALADCDCILETELGVTDVGLAAQLKEVEHGFFDLLALKPVSR